MSLYTCSSRLERGGCPLSAAFLWLAQLALLHHAPSEDNPRTMLLDSVLDKIGDTPLVSPLAAARDLDMN
jgi:hypothetical protein